MALENYQPKEQEQHIKRIDNSDKQDDIQKKTDAQILEIKNIQEQINKIKEDIKNIKNNILREKLEKKIKESEETLENNDITMELLKELWIKATEVIEIIRRENKDLIAYIENNDITKEEIPPYWAILRYIISIKDLPPKQMERKLEEKEAELKIDINKLLKKNYEEKILIINELSKSYDQKTLYEMCNIIWLPTWICEAEGEKNFLYIENGKWCIIIENWEMQYYTTIQEAIISKTAKNLTTNKKQSNIINFNGKGTWEISNEIRDEYNNEWQLDNTTLTTKDKKSYKATRKIKAPLKWLTASTFMKGNRYTWNKLIEKEWTTTIKAINWWNIYAGWNIWYNIPLNETTLTISATVQKNITKKNSTIEFTVEAWAEVEKWYIGSYYEINKYGDKTIWANLGYYINDRFSINWDVWYTYWSGQQDWRWYWVNVNYKIWWNFGIDVGYNNILWPNLWLVYRL